MIMKLCIKLAGDVMITINNAQYSIVFPKFLGIRQKFSEIEDVLSISFCQGQCLAVAAEAPPEVPRMIFNSKSGHSTLIISAINAQLIVNFDNNFCSNLDDCYKYIQEKVELLQRLFYPLLPNGILYTGLATNCILNPVLQNDSYALSFMKERFVKYESTREPCELHNKIVYIIDDIYYMNLSFSNTTVFNGVPSIFGSISSLSKKGYAISIELDVNDRYAFNFSENYRSNVKTVNGVIELSKKFFTEKLPYFVQERKLLV